jgi:hypothetical protein
MREINPFEPWRPDPGSNEPTRRDDQHQREPGEQEWYRQVSPPRPAWPDESRGEGPRKLFNFASIALVVGALIVLGQLGGTHLSRIGAAAGVLWLFALLSLVGRKWRWYWRLGFLLLAVAGPVACWYLVPTTGGVTLLDAQRRLAAIRQLAPGDVAGYKAGATERTQLGREFPTWKGDMIAAERSWLRQTAAKEIAEVKRLREKDPRAALAHLHKAQASLQRIDHFARGAQNDFVQAKREVVTAYLTQAEKDLEALLGKGQFATFSRKADETLQQLRTDARSVGSLRVMEERIKALRIKGVRKQTDIARDTLDRLFKAREYAKVATEGRRLLDGIRPAALPLNLDLDVANIINPLRRKAYEARLDDFAMKLGALYDKGELEAVPRQANEYAALVREEGRNLGMEVWITNRFSPIREKALRNRLSRAEKTLNELLTKKDHVAVALRGKELQGALEPEARVLGLAATVRMTLAETRRKALKARLESARQETRALLTKDRYQAVGEVGEKTARELGEEADAVALRAELDRFRDSCRVFADLAKKAKIEDKK